MNPYESFLMANFAPQGQDVLKEFIWDVRGSSIMQQKKK